MMPVHRAVNAQMCERYGLNPSQTTDARIEFDPGSRPRLVWAAGRRLSDEELKVLGFTIDGRPIPPAPTGLGRRIKRRLARLLAIKTRSGRPGSEVSA